MSLAPAALPVATSTQRSWKTPIALALFAVLLALTVVVYIQENVGWGWGFGIPAIAMFMSILVFLFGYPLYVRLKPGGSPFTRLTQVVAAALKKRSAAVPEASASTCGRPVASASAASKAAGAGPAGATQPDCSVAARAGISSPVRCGGESRMGPADTARGRSR